MQHAAQVFVTRDAFAVPLSSSLGPPGPTASDWAKLATEAPLADHSAYVPAPASSSTASAWAAAGAPQRSTVQGWANLAVTRGDSDADDDPSDDQQALPAAVVVVAQPHELQVRIQSLSENSTLAEFINVARDITATLGHAKTIGEVGTVGLCYCLLIDKVSFLSTASADKFIEKQIDSDEITAFVTEQLASTDASSRKVIESRVAEEQRIGASRKQISDRRGLLSAGLMAVQRASADAFVNHLCDRTEACGGVPQTFFEKHRGDETPYAKVSAHDSFTSGVPALGDAVGGDDALEGAAEQVSAVATQSLDSNVVGLQTDLTSANLKVYQVDLEIGLLFVLQDSELLVTFKLLTNLTRVNRCTGRNYANLHHSQCNVLPSRRRFQRVQRLHTSDGDQAQDLAERALWARLKTDPQYSVPTLRSQCQIHRVFHVMTIAFAISSAYLTGCIRLALSLRGPGHFLQFKQLLWSWLIAHAQWIWEDNPQGAGLAAYTHRQQIWDIFFPRTASSHQRRNRLKYWIVRRIPNGESRLSDVFQHLCRSG